MAEPTPLSFAQLKRLRRDAKKLAHTRGIHLHEVQQELAAERGYRNWSLMEKHSVPPAIDQRERYYVHGDQVEGRQDRYYCARCDVFAEAGHFEKLDVHHDREDGRMYMDRMNRWEQSRAERPEFRRPTAAPNYFCFQARAIVRAGKQGESPFFRWLHTQTTRIDAVGDFAVDAVCDSEFPRQTESVAAMRKHMSNHLFSFKSSAFIAVEDAMREFCALTGTARVE